MTLLFEEYLNKYPIDPECAEENINKDSKLT